MEIVNGIVTFEQVIPHVQMEDKLIDGVLIDGKKYRIEEVGPRTTDGGALLVKDGVTLSDLFFLEPPRTFGDIRWRCERYSLDVQFKLVEE